MINNNSWEQQNLGKKLPKPIPNVFAYNPQQVIKEANHQTGVIKDINRKKDTTLSAGKRISKNGNIYYEYRANRSNIHGRLK